MQAIAPPNAEDIRKVVEERLAALSEQPGLVQTVTIEWRGQQLSIPVITMPVDLLSYNPDTHRVRAQRSLDPVRDRELTEDPYGESSQNYLHQLLKGDPSNPTKVDPDFEALQEDLREHGQNEPGIMTRAGVLINGNTRRAALKELGVPHMQVGVLRSDASFEDLRTIELALQLRKDYKRDYSFMNFLLAIDEQVEAGRPASEIQSDFRIRAATFERSRWILEFIRDAIERSKVPDSSGNVTASLRLVDFETHKGKLEELHRTYTALKGRAPDEAEALREQRLLAIVLDKSKTDIRWIEADFAERYLGGCLPATSGEPAPPVKIPGTSIKAPGPNPKVQALRELTTKVLQARAIETAPDAKPDEIAAASASLREVREELEEGLKKAGRTGRVVKARLAPVDRLADANDALELCLAAVAEARATNNFEVDDLDDALLELRSHLVKLAQLTRDNESEADGVGWLRAAGALPGAN